MLTFVYAECRQLVHYAECHYAECRYAECRGALKKLFTFPTNFVPW
jgi:hypothetical protein